MRTGLPGRGHLLRRRRAGAVEGVLQGQRRILRRSRLARRRFEDRKDRQGPPARRCAAAAGHRALISCDLVMPVADAEAGRAQPTIAPRLPGFPWDRLAPASALAAAHPDGIVDLSIGTPVDPVPAVVAEALASATNSPGYPLTRGTPS